MCGISWPRACQLTDGCCLRSQQRIHDERQAKKAELERQREAARRIAMQQQPPVLKESAVSEMPAKLPPPAGTGSAAPAAGGGAAVSALPARLQQAMQVRPQRCARLCAPVLMLPLARQAHQQLAEAHRREAEEKLLLAEEAKRKARDLASQGARAALLTIVMPRAG